MQNTRKYICKLQGSTLTENGNMEPGLILGNSRNGVRARISAIFGERGVEFQKRGGSRAFISLMTTGRCGLMRTWPVTAPGCSARRISTRTTEIRDKWMKYALRFGPVMPISAD